MTTLVLTLLRLGFLALLWIFVISLVLTVRKDVYGTEIRDRRTSNRDVAPSEGNQPPAQVGPGPRIPHIWLRCLGTVPRRSPTTTATQSYSRRDRRTTLRNDSATRSNPHRHWQITR